MRESGRYNCNEHDSVKCNIINTCDRATEKEELVLLWTVGGMSWRTECLIWILEQ